MRLLGWPLTILVMTSARQTCGSMPPSLQVSISEAMVAQCSPPPSEPAKRAFFLLSAIGRIVRSTTLVSISMRPSSRKEALPAREGVADRLGEFGLLADQPELLTQPRFERLDDRPAPLSAVSSSFVGVAAADLALDSVETGDTLERLAGNGSGTCGDELVEAPRTCDQRGRLATDDLLCYPNFHNFQNAQEFRCLLDRVDNRRCSTWALRLGKQKQVRVV
jgi:hypothetical protein